MTNSELEIIGLTACVYGELETLKDAIDKGWNYRNEDELAFRLAVGAGNMALIDFLLEKGVDVQAESNQALENAINKKDTTLVRKLVAKGAEIDALKSKVDVDEPLKAAVRAGFLDRRISIRVGAPTHSVDTGLGL